MKTKPPEDQEVEKVINFRQVVAKGYARTVRQGKRLITIMLPDETFNVARCCGHWDRSGARVGCPCRHDECPCHPSLGSKKK